jgi:hypothetical protein
MYAFKFEFHDEIDEYEKQFRADLIPIFEDLLKYIM